MNRIFLTRLLPLVLALNPFLRAQVVINEVSSVQSDRLLQRPPSAPPRLGNLPAWFENDFTVPAWWQAGPGPLGFGAVTNVQPKVRNITPTFVMRRDFTASAATAASTSALELVIDYSDGFVAYVNGVEVARRNTGAAGGYPWHHQIAFNAISPGAPETISLGSANTLLRTGANCLAIQVHNNSVTDGTMFCSATLRVAGGATLVVPGDTWNWREGTHPPSGGLYEGADFSSNQAGPNWSAVDYDDTAWTATTGGLGYDTNPDYLPQLGANLTAQVRNIAWSLYGRCEFTLTQQQYDQLTSTTMTVDWDDGYALYLNGYELSRWGFPQAPGTLIPYNQSATGHGASRDNGGNNPALIQSVSVPKPMLRVGKNVLSAQVHNETLGSSDLLLDVRFSGVSGGSTLTWVTLGTPWRYRVGTSEIGAPQEGPGAPPAPEFLDWIELKNSSASDVDLSGWHITDDADEPQKWTFPAGVTIPAGGYLVIFASGRNVTAPAPGGALHTNFSLNSKGEYLCLRNAAGVIQSELASIPDQNAFHTWGLDSASGEYRFLDRGTPGAANVPGSASGVTKEVNFSVPSGFHASPMSVALTSNTPGAEIRYTLDGSEPTEASTLYSAPFDPGAIQPGPGPGAGTILREVFQWSSGTFVSPPNLPAGASPTSAMLVTDFETPSNSGDYYTQRVRGYIHPPQTGSYTFWIASDDDGELKLSTNHQPVNMTRIAHITGGWTSPREWNKYTTQQSAPVALQAGQRYYIEAVSAEGGGGDNLAVGWQGPGLPPGVISVVEGRYLSPPETLPPGTSLPPRSAVVRARAFSPGRLPSETRVRNYVIGGSPLLSTRLAVFLSGPGSQTFYAPDGIFAQVGGNWNSGSWAVNDPKTDYNFCVVRGDAFERPMHMELVGPGNTIIERTNIGARFAGSPWSRPQYQLKNAETGTWNGNVHNKPQMNIFFRGDYGISRMKNNGLIPTSIVPEWDTMRIRAGKNDGYNPFIIDEWMRRTFALMGNPSPQGTFASLFINGSLKSLFNPTERPRESFFQEYYGTSNPWDVNTIGEWESGDGVAYGQMDAYFRNNDFTSLANYQAGAALWDPVNAADYFIINAWGATQDWPHNNYAFARERAPGATWKFSMWDAEGAFGIFGQSNTHNTFQSELHVNSASGINTEGTTAALVFRRFHQNAEWRLLFADRVQKHFFNGGVMTAANRNSRWNAMRAEVEPLQQAILGQGFYNGHWDNWANRDATFFSQISSIFLWPSTLAPTATPYGGTVTGGVALGNPNASGTIYYTTDGSDPRAIGGAVQGTAYTSPIPITSPVTLKARVYSSGTWSPLIETAYAPATPAIVVSEIYYNPPGVDDTEYIELSNVGAATASLNGARFTSGITFTFGNVTLAPGASLVLVRNSAAFSAAFPGVPVAGQYGGELNNDSDTITLVDIVGEEILSFTYHDSNVAGWPDSPDGDGTSLVLRRPFHETTDPGLPASWRASSTNGGAPGVMDSTRFTGNALADDDKDGFPALAEYSMGTSDADPSSRPVLTAHRDPSGYLFVTFTYPVSADDVVFEGIESTNLHGWDPAIFVGETDEGAGIKRSAWRSTGTSAPKFMRVRVRLQ